MADTNSTVLPYRTDGEDLSRLIEARAKGRELRQIQTLNFTDAGFQGTVATAYALKLLNSESDEVTESGREFALSRDELKKKTVLLEAMLQYEPYELLLEAVFSRGPVQETETDWIETWWSTHKYGNSQRNRSDGSTTLGKLLQYVGLGDFFIGRRGRPTRIEWQEDAIEKLKKVKTEVKSELSEEKSIEGKSEEQTTSSRSQVNFGDKETQIQIINNVELKLPLGPNRIAILSLPPELTESEKKRLLSLVDLMITVVEIEKKDGDQM